MKEKVQVIDLGEATALLTLGFDLIRLDNGFNGTYKIFVFSPSHPATNERAIDAIDSYKRKKLQVDASTFYWNGKILKDRIHEKTVLEGK